MFSFEKRIFLYIYIFQRRQVWDKFTTSGSGFVKKYTKIKINRICERKFSDIGNKISTFLKISIPQKLLIFIVFYA